MPIGMLLKHHGTFDSILLCDISLLAYMKCVYMEHLVRDLKLDRRYMPERSNRRIWHGGMKLMNVSPR